MKRIVTLVLATAFSGLAAANCDSAQGAVDLDRCPIERAQLEREVRALAFAERLCVSAAQCNDLGSKAYGGGQYRLAIHYFEQQVSHAEEHRDLAAAADAYHNATLAHLRGRNCLDARDWLDAATALDRHDHRVAVHERLYALTCGS